MNIFVIDHDPVKAAEMQCDKHVVKMIVESAQILCTTHRVLDGTLKFCLLYTSPSPRDGLLSRMPSSA